MARLSSRNHDFAIGKLIVEKSIGFVSKHFNVHTNTISRLQNRLNARGTTTVDRPGSGRPRVTTPRQDQFIQRLHLRERFRPSTSTAGNIPGFHPISSKTVRFYKRGV